MLCFDNGPVYIIRAAGILCRGQVSQDGLKAASFANDFDHDGQSGMNDRDPCDQDSSLSSLRAACCAVCS